MLIRVSVQPLIAETTSMVRSRSTAFETMSTTFDIASVVATEVPPNFITCIYNNCYIFTILLSIYLYIKYLPLPKQRLDYLCQLLPFEKETIVAEI